MAHLEHLNYQYPSQYYVLLADVFAILGTANEMQLANQIHACQRKLAALESNKSIDMDVLVQCVECQTQLCRIRQALFASSPFLQSTNELLLRLQALTAPEIQPAKRECQRALDICRSRLQRHRSHDDFSLTCPLAVQPVEWQLAYLRILLQYSTLRPTVTLLSADMARQLTAHSLPAVERRLDTLIRSSAARGDRSCDISFLFACDASVRETILTRLTQLGYRPQETTVYW